MWKKGKQNQEKKQITMTDIQSKNPSSIFPATEGKKTKKWDNYNFAIKIAAVNKE